MEGRGGMRFCASESPYSLEIGIARVGHLRHGFEVGPIA
jgi:hypothetical protein